MQGFSLHKKMVKTVPSVSVIIPVYNRETVIGSVIRALLNQNQPPTEIIVVDDGSKDRTAEIVRSYPVRYIIQENKGPASARNRGFKESSGDIIVFIDSDCIARDDLILNLLEGFDSPEVGAVAGSYDIANPENLLARLIHEEIKWRHSRLGKYTRAFGSYCVAIRRDVLQRAGGFDESYKMACAEDTDLSYRILKMGYKIRFTPDAVVAHYHPENLMGYLRVQSNHGYWRMKLYKNHRDMMKGDDYTILKDILELPLALSVIFSIPFILTRSIYLFFLPLSTLFLLQLFPAIQISIMKKDVKYLYFSGLGFIRSFARLFGMIRGVWTFWIRGL